MKINRKTLTYWGVLCVSLALYQFGFAISIEHSDREVPFAEIWSSADLIRAFRFYPDDELSLIFLAGVIGGFKLPRLMEEKQRALFYAVVALVGMAHFDFLMAWLMFLSPLLIGRQFLGLLDGESYVEDMHQAGAAGFFVLFCFITSLWRFCRLVRVKSAPVSEVANRAGRILE